MVLRAVDVCEPRGFMKAIVHADTSQILGATILGIDGGEFMTVLQVAMIGKLPSTTLRDAIFCNLTLAEGLKDLFGAIDM